MGNDSEFQNCISVSMQLQEFDEDVVITLQAKNPQAPQNIVRFDYTVGEYIPIKLGETMIDHLEIEVGGVFTCGYASRYSNCEFHLNLDLL